MALSLAALASSENVFINWLVEGAANFPSAVVATLPRTAGVYNITSSQSRPASNLKNILNMFLPHQSYL